MSPYELRMLELCAASVLEDEPLMALTKEMAQFMVSVTRREGKAMPREMMNELRRLGIDCSHIQEMP